MSVFRKNKGSYAYSRMWGKLSLLYLVIYVCLSVGYCCKSTHNDNWVEYEFLEIKVLSSQKTIPKRIWNHSKNELSTKIL